MLDLTNFRRLIESEVNDNFSTCFVMFENVGVPPEVEIDSWVSIQDKQSFSQGTGMGEPSFLIGGNLYILIFVPKGAGTDKARQIAQELSDLLGSREIEGIHLQAPEFHGNPGADRENPWYQMNLIIPYSAVMGQSIDC